MKLKARSMFAGMTLAALALSASSAAQAVDGCKLLLCLAGPWASISECTPTVRQAFRDLARGRPFPACGMSGGTGTGSAHIWTDDSNCPAMYKYFDHEGRYTGCSFAGRVDVHINGQRWSEVYWDMSGNTASWYSSAAKTGLSGGGPLDESFNRDLAAWNDAKVPACTAAGGTPTFGRFGDFLSCSIPEGPGGYGGGG